MSGPPHPPTGRSPLTRTTFTDLRGYQDDLEGVRLIVLAHIPTVDASGARMMLTPGQDVTEAGRTWPNLPTLLKLDQVRAIPPVNYLKLKMPPAPTGVVRAEAAPLARGAWERGDPAPAPARASRAQLAASGEVFTANARDPDEATEGGNYPPPEGGHMVPGPGRPRVQAAGADPDVDKIRAAACRDQLLSLTFKDSMATWKVAFNAASIAFGAKATKDEMMKIRDAWLAGPGATP